MDNKKVNIDEIFKNDPVRDPEKVKEENAKLEDYLKSEKHSIDVLSELKLKVKQKKEEQKPEPIIVVDEPILITTAQKMPALVSKKKVGINLGVVGLGQAGSRVAEEFHKQGYDVGVINTAAQDLQFIEVNPDQKLLLDGSLGGTGKDRNFSLDIFKNSQQLVFDFMEKVVAGNDMVLLVASGGGGTGSGGLPFVCKLASNLGLPTAVIYILPKHSEGAANKKNGLNALSELSELVSEKVIDSLIVVDNARLEVLLSDVGHGLFWNKANKMIVNPITKMNFLTSTPSDESLDPSDFGNILTAGGLTIYGQMVIEDYMQETALAEAVIDSLSDNVLSEGFDLSQTTAGGVFFVGSAEAINSIPSINLDYCQHMISELTNGAKLYRGIYIDDSMDNHIEVISIFSGLGLPEARVKNLQEEVLKLDALSKDKESKMTANVTLNLQKPKVTDMREEIHNKIKEKSSGFNKLQAGGKTQTKSIIDLKRKR